MSTEKTIPIVIGVTGHRMIREEDTVKLHDAVVREILRLRGICPNSQFVMLNSLCEGADLLCAEAAVELEIPLIAALPAEPEEYERDFSGLQRERFSRLCSIAEEVFVVPDIEKKPDTIEDREFHYRQAGIYIAAHSHLLLALWDGNAGEGVCGTAETVDFALNGNYTPASGIAVRSERNESVIHIFTPRDARSDRMTGEICSLGNPEALGEILKQTDEFNRLAQSIEEKGSFILSENSDKDKCISRMENVNAAAEKLSMESARLFRITLAILAAAGSLLTFAFLMYDEAEAYWMILVCGVMLAFAWGIGHFAKQSDCHRRYLEFRVLAESLRVQIYLRYAGSHISVPSLLPWSQQEETTWILCALCALEIGTAPQAKNDIHDCWVESQREYHLSAGKRTLRNLKLSGHIVRSSLILSVTLYLAAVLFELICGGLIFSLGVSVGNVETYRTLLKILLGTISAVTLFTASFYGRLSLDRTQADHQKMIHFYEKMSGLISRYGQTEEILSVLAREELIENGNWCSFQRDNKPDFNI